MEQTRKPTYSRSSLSSLSDTSVSRSLLLPLADPETLKLLLSPKPVLLYSSTWGASSLFPGKIQLCDSFIWTSPREQHKRSVPFSLLRSGKLLTGAEAAAFLKACVLTKQPVDADRVLVLSYAEALCLVLPDKDLCARLASLLGGLMNGLPADALPEENKALPALERNDSHYSDIQYGAVFDISEPLGGSDQWKEIKITFVKEESSQTEFLTYDRSQQNLYDSVSEILNAFEKYLDLPNFCIVNEYLLDVTRREYVDRIKNTSVFREIQPLVTEEICYSRRENAQVREIYKELNGKALGIGLVQMMKGYEAQDNGDSIADAMNLLFIQKLDICIEIHSVACEHAMAEMRKSLDLPVREVEEGKTTMRKSENPKDVEQRIHQILNQKEEEPSKKSFFRDACECIII
jgi:hypothetical protein